MQCLFLAEADIRPLDGNSGFVQVFGRRQRRAIHALRRPAFEKRQGTKSREVRSVGRAAGSAMGI
jgi:hypothetical protein